MLLLLLLLHCMILKYNGQRCSMQHFMHLFISGIYISQKKKLRIGQDSQDCM